MVHQLGAGVGPRPERRRACGVPGRRGGEAQPGSLRAVEVDAAGPVAHRSHARFQPRRPARAGADRPMAGRHLATLVTAAGRDFDARRQAQWRGARCRPAGGRRRSRAWRKADGCTRRLCAPPFPLPPDRPDSAKRHRYDVMALFDGHGRSSSTSSARSQSRNRLPATSMVAGSFARSIRCRSSSRSSTPGRASTGHRRNVELRSSAHRELSFRRATPQFGIEQEIHRHSGETAFRPAGSGSGCCDRLRARRVHAGRVVVLALAGAPHVDHGAAQRAFERIVRGAFPIRLADDHPHPAERARSDGQVDPCPCTARLRPSGHGSQFVTMCLRASSIGLHREGRA